MNLREAQDNLDMLAREYKVPPIKVVKISELQRSVPCYFSDAPDWHIGITNDASLLDLKHEFMHYLHSLLRIPTSLEEKLIKLTEIGELE